MNACWIVEIVEWWHGRVHMWLAIIITLSTSQAPSRRHVIPSWLFFPTPVSLLLARRYVPIVTQGDDVGCTNAAYASLWTCNACNWNCKCIGGWTIIKYQLVSRCC